MGDPNKIIRDVLIAILLHDNIKHKPLENDLNYNGYFHWRKRDIDISKWVKTKQTQRRDIEAQQKLLQQKLWFLLQLKSTIATPQSKSFLQKKLTRKSLDKKRSKTNLAGL